MTRQVVLLRGINVGRSVRVAMPDLRRVLEGVGATGVRTYVQSGNAVLDAPHAPDELERSVRTALRDELGVDVPVMVRTADELAAVVAGLPWQGLDPRRLHVGFLSGEPDSSRIDPEALLPERVVVRGREAYLDPGDAVQRSRVMGLRLGVDMTARNWRTVTALHDLARSPEA